MLVELTETIKSAGREFRARTVVNVSTSYGHRLIAENRATEVRALGHKRTVRSDGAIIGRAESEARPAPPKEPKAPATMHPEELKAELTTRGVKFSSRAKRDDLIALLTEARAKDTEGDTTEEPPADAKSKKKG